MTEQPQPVAKEPHTIGRSKQFKKSDIDAYLASRRSVAPAPKWQPWRRRPRPKQTSDVRGYRPAYAILAPW
jgi:hypothetical protein